MTMRPDQIEHVQFLSDQLTLASRALDRAIHAAQNDGYEVRLITEKKTAKGKRHLISKHEAVLVWPIISTNEIQAEKRMAERAVKENANV